MVEGAEKRTPSRGGKLFGYIVVLSIFAVIYVFSTNILGGSGGSQEDVAASMCNEQFKVIAHPGYAYVPRVRSSGSAGEFYFAWPSGAGLSLGGRETSGHCVVNATATQITSLTVAGKQQIWRAPEER